MDSFFLGFTLILINYAIMNSCFDFKKTVRVSTLFPNMYWYFGSFTDQCVIAFAFLPRSEPKNKCTASLCLNPAVFSRQCNVTTHRAQNPQTQESSWARSESLHTAKSTHNTFYQQQPMRRQPVWNKRGMLTREK